MELILSIHCIIIEHTWDRFMKIDDTLAVLSNKSEELHEVYIESIMPLH